MDIERVRYSLARYLRARLLKIEKQVDYIYQTPTIKDKLSPQEVNFAEILYDKNRKFLKDLIKDKLTGEAQQFYKTADLVESATPSLRQFVFFKALQEVELKRSGTQRSQQIPEGTIGIASYADKLDDLVRDRSVLLL